MAKDIRRSIQVTAKAHTALRQIVKLTGLKMFAAAEQAVAEKLDRIKAEKGRAA